MKPYNKLIKLLENNNTNTNNKLSQIYNKLLNLETNQTELINIFNSKLFTRQYPQIICNNVLLNKTQFDLSINDSNIFNQNFNLLTKNILSSIDWNNILVVGESITLPLLNIFDNTIKDMDNVYINICIYGLNNDEFIKKIHYVYNIIKNNCPFHLLCTYDTNYLYFLKNSPYKTIRISLHNFLSPIDVISRQNIDLNCVGFDGRDIWCSINFHYALINKSNCNYNNNCNDNYDDNCNKDYERIIKIYTKFGFSINLAKLCDNNKILINPAINYIDWANLDVISRIYLYGKYNCNKYNNYNPIATNDLTINNFVSDIKQITLLNINQNYQNEQISKDNQINQQNMILMCNNKLNTYNSIIDKTLTNNINDEHCIYGLTLSQLALLYGNYNIYNLITNKIITNKEHLYYTKKTEHIISLCDDNIIQNYNANLKVAILFEHHNTINYYINNKQVDYKYMLKLCIIYNKIDIYKTILPKCNTDEIILGLIYSIEYYKMDFFNLTINKITDINHIIKYSYNEKQYCSALIVLLNTITKYQNNISKQMLNIINTKEIKYIYTIDDINNTANNFNSNKLINLEQIDQPLYIIYASHNLWLFDQIYKIKSYLFDFVLVGYNCNNKKNIDGRNIIDNINLLIKKYDDLLKYYGTFKNHSNTFQQYELCNESNIFSPNKIHNIENKLQAYKTIYSLFTKNTSNVSNLANNINININKYIIDHSINFSTINTHEKISTKYVAIYLQLYESIYCNKIDEFKKIGEIFYKKKLPIHVYSYSNKSSSNKLSPLYLSIIKYNEYMSKSIMEIIYSSTLPNKKTVLLTKQLFEYIITNNRSDILGMFYDNPHLFDPIWIHSIIRDYLELVITLNNIDMIVLFIKYGCKFDKNLLYLCIGHPEMLVFMFKYACNLTNQEKYLFDINNLDDNGNNIIQQFFTKANKINKDINKIIECIQILAKLCPKIISQKNNKGKNILCSSIKYGNELIFQKIIEIGTPIECDNNGLHLIHYIAKYGNIFMMDIILRTNNDFIDLLTENTLMTPLIVSAKYDNHIMVYHLLNRNVNVNVNVCDIFGNYPHHYALINNNHKLFNKLQDLKSIYVTNNYGLIPYDYFIEHIVNTNEESTNEVIDTQQLVNNYKYIRLTIYNKKQVKIINYMFELIYDNK